MSDELSAFVEGVLAEAERIGLAPTTIKYYRCCCRAVVRYCFEREIERLTVQAVDAFLAATDERARRGEIGPVNRSALEKTARMMLEFEQIGAIDWHRRRPPAGVSASDAAVIGAFAASVRDELAAGSMRLMVGEVRQFLRYLDRAGRPLGAVTADDVRGFLVEVRPRRASGMGNTVWALKRFFGFANERGLTGLRVEELLARVGPRRARALPCFTPEETGRILAAIETNAARGKRDYAILRLALSTGLRCGDIAALRLDEID